MVAVVAAEKADEAVAQLTTAGQSAWIMGEVAEYDASSSDRTGDDFTQGAKGVDGGAVLLTGSYSG